jgi:AcrR family transcriptional regulator
VAAAGGAPSANAAALSTRDRIMHEAAALFQTQGFEPTTMRTIATAAGLTPGALYWHFPSKDAILFSILAAQSAAYDRTLEPVRGAATASEKLRLYVKAMIEWQVDRFDPEHYLATIPFGVNHLLQSLAPEQKDHVTNLVQEHHGLLIQIIIEGIADGSFAIVDTKVAAYGVLNMCEYVVTWWTLDDSRTPEDLVRVHQDLAMRMLALH